MRKILSFMVLLCVIASPIAQADLVFSFRQQNPGSIVQPDSAIFDLIVTSTVAGQQVDGFDIGLSITPGGTAGTFTAWEVPAGLLAGSFWNPLPFAPSTSYGLLSPFTFTNANTTEYNAGRLTLSTLGATPGTYSMVWDQGNTVPIIGANVIATQFVDGSYTITAIPEPAVGSLIGLVVTGMIARRRRVA